MGRIWMPGGGGGADLDVITAGAGDVLAGKVIVDKDGNPLTGTVPDNTGTALEVATNGKTLIPKGYFDGTTYVTNTQATMAGGTKTPTTSAQTIACNGKLMTSNIVIPAFSLPAASSIKKGVTVTIYGKSVTGTWEGYVSDILYLYNAGVWSNIGTAGLNNSTANSNTITFSDSATVRTNATINLTQYNYVKIYGKVSTPSDYYSQCIYFGVSTKSNLSSVFNCNKKESCASKTLNSYFTAILDISDLSGNYYIYCEGEALINSSTKVEGHTVTIQKIYLSKT